MKLALVLLAASLPCGFAAEPAKIDAATIPAVEKALQRVAQISSPQSNRPFIPVFYVKPIASKDTKSEWREHLVFVPGTEAIPDFPAKALETNQKVMVAQKARNVIEGYIVIYDGDKQVHLVVHQGSSPVQKFSAPYVYHSEVAKLKPSDFKPE